MNPATSSAEAWEEAADDLVRSPRLRRELSLRNPAYFDSRYCGMQWAKHRKRWLTTMVEAFAEARASLRTPHPKRIKLLMLGPRKHGKTEASITLATLLVCADRSLRILYISATEGQAKKRLRRIKELLRSERITADWTTAPDEGYGPFRPEKRTKDVEEKWHETVIYVLRDVSYVDPTIEAVGAGGTVLGGHFDVIILDDPEDKKKVLSPTNRARRKEWLRDEVGPMLNPGGLMIMIGTRKHHDDLYGMALKDTTWRLIKDKAILVGRPEDCQPVYDTDEHGRKQLVDWIVEGDYEVLWPERYPLKVLLDEWERMRPTGFGREMQHEVTDNATAPFKRPHLDTACRRGEQLILGRGPWPPGLLIVQAWDPAFVTDERHAEKTDSDYQVGVTWGLSVLTRDRYLMDIHRARGHGHDEKANDVVRLWNSWRPPRQPARCEDCGWVGDGDPEEHVCPVCDGELEAMMLTIADHVKHGWAFAVGMEKNNGGQFLAVAAMRAQDMPLVMRWTGTEVNDPYKGVPVLGSHLETGRVVLPYGDHETQQMVDIVCDELHALGTSAHDDIPLAIWIAEMLAQRALAMYDKYVRRYGAPDFKTLAA